MTNVLLTLIAVVGLCIPAESAMWHDVYCPYPVCYTPMCPDLFGVSRCRTCKKGYAAFLDTDSLNYKCVQGCPRGYFKHPNLCLECTVIRNCVDCTGPSSCKECRAGYEVNQFGRCSQK